jgi:hypothetical protein
MSFDIFKKVNERLNDKGIDQSAGMPRVPYDVRAFLGSLALLKGIPIYYLIPDENYLPKIFKPFKGTTIEQGCLRMFWLDKEWVECLMDGALSIGSDDDRAVLLSKAMGGNYVAEVYYNDVKEQIKKQLAGLFGPEEFTKQLESRLGRKSVMMKNGQPEPTEAQNNWCYTGFLMRSSVTAWPGVEVLAKGRNPDPVNGIDTPVVRSLQVVRLERITEDTLFCICEGIISQIEITQPPEVFHFGLSKDENENYYADETKVTFRETAGVIDISTIVRTMNDALEEKLRIKNSAMLAQKLYSKPLKISLDISWEKE